MPGKRASALVLAGALGVSGASCAEIKIAALHEESGAAGENAGGGEAGADGGGRGGRAGRGGAAAHAGAGGGEQGAAAGDAGEGPNDEGGRGGSGPALAAGKGGKGGKGQHAGGHGGTSAGAGGAASAGSGGAGVPDQLDLCLRLGNTDSINALDIQQALDFEKAFIADCRINWVFYLYEDSKQNLHERQDFLNQLTQFNYRLWGCAGTAPADSFDLIYKPTPLTLADATALIDAYVDSAEVDLSMSPPELAEMRALLERLSEPLLISPDPGGFSASRCNANAGAGGQAGGQGGNAAGGSPQAGQGGQGGQAAAGEAGLGGAG